MNITVSEVHVPLGSTIGVGRGTDDDGKTVWFGGDHRPMLDLMQAVQAEGPQPAHVDSWQVVTDMSLVCETIGDHDWKAEDIADGVVGGGAAHVWCVYCTRCDAEGDEEDLA